MQTRALLPFYMRTSRRGSKLQDTILGLTALASLSVLASLSTLSCTSTTLTVPAGDVSDPEAEVAPLASTPKTLNADFDPAKLGAAPPAPNAHAHHHHGDAEAEAPQTPRQHEEHPR